MSSPPPAPAPLRAGVTASTAPRKPPSPPRVSHALAWHALARLPWLAAVSRPPARIADTSARTHTHTHTRRAWLAMSKEEQDAQLATMTPEQQDAIKAAVEGNRKTVDLPKEQK